MFVSFGSLRHVSFIFCVAALRVVSFLFVLCMCVLLFCAVAGLFALWCCTGVDGVLFGVLCVVWLCDYVDVSVYVYGYGLCACLCVCCAFAYVMFM